MLISLSDIEGVNDSHHCSLCDIPLTDAEILLLDDLADNPQLLLQRVTLDDKMALVYIGGYVAFKEIKYAAAVSLQGEVDHLPKDVTAYFRSLDRGNLCCPSLELLDFLILAHCFFVHTKQHMCRVRLASVLGRFTNVFHIDLDLTKSALKRVCNIFMKTFAANLSENDCMAPQRKIAKLSSTSATK